MKDSKRHIKNVQKLVVLGAGESGVGAAILAKQKDYDVFVSDFGEIEETYKKELTEHELEYEEKQHSEDKILTADLIIKSPGIPRKAAIIQKIIENKIPILSEIEFAAKHSKGKFICITGSNGKTTTASLTWFILKNAGLDVALAGNIGQSFALQVAAKDHEYYVLELSSFMLDDMVDFRADIAVLLNITPDHLDRYNHQFDHYINSKLKIINNQTSQDTFIYCADDVEINKALLKHIPVAQTLQFSQEKKNIEGAFLNTEGEIKIQLNNKNLFTMSIDELALQGKHNVYNSMASGIVAKILDLRNESIRESMGEYQNIPHRLEFVSCIGGVSYVNDSKATNVNSVWYALESIKPNIVLILGGVDKGNDYEMLKPLVKSKVTAIVCIGDDTKRIQEVFENDTKLVVHATSMKDAVLLSSHLAQKGDTVLLSPACASFDWFKNYEDRGNQFKNAVKEL